MSVYSSNRNVFITFSYQVINDGGNNYVVVLDDGIIEDGLGEDMTRKEVTEMNLSHEA